MTIRFRNLKQSILHRVADNLDTEIDKYIIDILTGMKHIDNFDSKLLRRRIYEENKQGIINDIITILQEEVNQLKAENNRLYQKNKFELSESQETKINVWKKSHDCKYKKSSDEMFRGAIGGQYTYEFVPTSIGVFCGVKCSCGQKLDISKV